MNRACALLTDFGLDDPYVGQVKAVLFSLAPTALILDISHNVPPFSVSSGALFLSASRPYFPDGTVFVCIVDPGVGSERDLLCLSGRRHTLLGPDNGLLAPAYRDMLREGPVTAHAIAPKEYAGSGTFHGRDILAPAAARLLLGAAPASLGPELARPPAAPVWVEPQAATGHLICTVLHVDRFGNCILNLPTTADRLPAPPFSVTPLHTGMTVLLLPATRYSELPDGVPGLVPGSQGFYELACNKASAAAYLTLAPGLTCRISGQTP